MLRKLLSMFTTKKPFVPPTAKQIEYATLCGLDVRPEMDRECVSRAIDAAFAADPKLKFKVSARRKKKERQSTEEWERLPDAAKREFKKWDTASDEYDHFLVVFNSGRKTIVDILECEGVHVEPGSQAIVVDFLSPRIESIVAGYDGRQEVREDVLCWDQKLPLRTTDIQQSRKLSIHDDEVKKYQSTIKRTIEQLAK